MRRHDRAVPSPRGGRRDEGTAAGVGQQVSAILSNELEWRDRVTQATEHARAQIEELYAELV